MVQLYVVRRKLAEMLDKRALNAWNTALFLTADVAVNGSALQQDYVGYAKARGA